jgi:hypothetical protein
MVRAHQIGECISPKLPSFVKIINKIKVYYIWYINCLLFGDLHINGVGDGKFKNR